MVAFGIHERMAEVAPRDGRRKPEIWERVTPNGQRPRSWRALRVLIVDEQQDMSGGLLRLVRRWGHAARMAHHGLAALIAAADQHPDVVLLDLELPSMDGRQVASQLRLGAPQSDNLIIALADWTDDERCRQCRASGIDLVLVNPVDTDVVKTLLLLEFMRLNRLKCRPQATNSIL